MVFHPNVQTDTKLTAMVPDFVRIARFVYTGSDYDRYNGLQLTKWQIDPVLMLNETANPENAKYNAKISGCANLRVALQAPALATKGHFYQIADVVHDQLAIIRDKKGTELKPDPIVDETEIGVEQITGVTLVAKQRLQMNFQIDRDELFGHLQQPSIITPLTFVQRECEMTQDQVNALLGDLYTARTAKKVITVIFCIMGGLLLVLAIIMYQKYNEENEKRLKGNEEAKEDEMLLPGIKTERRMI